MNVYNICIILFFVFLINVSCKIGSAMRNNRHVLATAQGTHNFSPTDRKAPAAYSFALLLPPVIRILAWTTVNLENNGMRALCLKPLVLNMWYRSFVSI